MGLWLGVAICSCLDLSNTVKPPSTGPDTEALQTRAEQHLSCRGLAPAAAVPGGRNGI